MTSDNTQSLRALPEPTIPQPTIPQPTIPQPTIPQPTIPQPTIKVCGLTNSGDARQAADAGANMLGFVVVPESPRGITAAEVAVIRESFSSQMPTVLVTTRGDPREIHISAKEAGVSHVQLCGAARAQDFCGFSFRLLRRIGVREQAREEMAEWAEYVEAFVLDHPSAPGGTGQMVNLDLAAELAAKYPCLLAGGLGGANVAISIEKVRPLGVDASSRLEYAPGEKNPNEVRRYVTNALSAMEYLL